ncbi:MAG: T9SS type A sorting domain-containing protein [Bacteroidota bacterium]|nr:T9SS type A sorting domain-containing protein [Bacteroidota bacterium]
MKSINSLFKKNFFLIAFFFNLCEFCSAQWQWVWPTPQGIKLNSVSFIDNNTGIFVGDGGVVLRTTNSGVDFNNMNLGFNNDLNSSVFFDQNLCFAGGSFSKIFRSTNSGINWTGSDIEFNNGITRIFFINKTTGWASALYHSLYKTTNSGINWIHYDLPYLSRANSVFFINETTGFVAGGGNRVKLIKTTNEGVNWVRTNYFYDGIINYIHFLDSLVGFTCGSEGEIAKTTDGGDTWTLQNTGVDSGSFTSLKLIDNIGFSTYINNNGICAILKSTNDGRSWQPIYYDTLDYLTSLEFKDQNIFVTGSLGRILKSTNDGKNWISNKANVSNGFGYINFINEMTGIACSYGYNSCTMYKTSNGGVNWSIQARDTIINSIFSTDFVDLNTGYKVGGNSNLISRIYKTTNGGINWIRQTIQTSVTISDVDFIDANRGIVCGMGGLIAKTSNGGLTWQITNSGGPHWQSAICYIDNNNCISGNSEGEVYKSTNGGNSWFISATNIGISINSISFSDHLTGYIGANGVFKTTDGGYNWTNILTGVVSHDLKFYNSNIGFVSAYDGRVYRTTNGGLSWINESYISNTLNFHSYCFIDPETVYMLGSNLLFKTKNGGVITNQFENTYSVPTSFYLLQNYPNPFNPVTTISYSIPKEGFVKIKIYDIAGKEINTLINEFKQSGSYNIKFEGSNLSSGVYYYKMESSDFAQIKKMVLIK